MLHVDNYNSDINQLLDSSRGVDDTGYLFGKIFYPLAKGPVASCNQRRWASSSSGDSSS